MIYVDGLSARSRPCCSSWSVYPYRFEKKNKSGIWRSSSEWKIVWRTCPLLTTLQSAECAFSLLSAYNTKIARNEKFFQELLQVDERHDHRNDFKCSTEKNLKSLVYFEIIWMERCFSIIITLLPYNLNLSTSEIEY